MNTQIDLLHNSDQINDLGLFPRTELIIPPRDRNMLYFRSISNTIVSRQLQVN